MDMQETHGKKVLKVIKRAFSGSVSDYIAHHARVPLIVVPPAPSK